MQSVVALGLLLSFAAWLCLHLSMVWRLLFRQPRWWSLLALVPLLLPLAPYWGYQTGLRKSALSWGLLLALYTVMLVLGHTVR
jgi:hypothetical protein